MNLKSKLRQQLSRAWVGYLLAVAMLFTTAAAGYVIGRGEPAPEPESDLTAAAVLTGLDARLAEPEIGFAADSCQTLRITLGAKSYDAIFLGEAGEVKLADPEQYLNETTCTGRGPVAGVRIGYDRETTGCVRYTIIDGREWILSSGVGLIRGGDGRLARETDADAVAAGCGYPQFTHVTAPVPPIEDVQGYRVERDSPICGGYEVFLPATGFCTQSAALVPGENGRFKLK